MPSNAHSLSSSLPGSRPDDCPGLQVTGGRMTISTSYYLARYFWLYGLDLDGLIPELACPVFVAHAAAWAE